MKYLYSPFLLLWLIAFLLISLSCSDGDFWESDPVLYIEDMDSTFVISDSLNMPQCTSAVEQNILYYSDMDGQFYYCGEDSLYWSDILDYDKALMDCREEDDAWAVLVTNEKESSVFPSHPPLALSKASVYEGLFYLDFSVAVPGGALASVGSMRNDAGFIRVDGQDMLPEEYIQRQCIENTLSTDEAEILDQAIGEVRTKIELLLIHEASAWGVDTLSKYIHSRNARSVGSSGLIDEYIRIDEGIFSDAYFSALDCRYPEGDYSAILTTHSEMVYFCTSGDKHQGDTIRTTQVDLVSFELEDNGFSSSSESSSSEW
jgi:hypothetical protein